VSHQTARRARAWFLGIEAEEHEGIAILTLAGRIGVEAAPRLDAAIVAATQGPQPRLVLDLEAVDYVSSAGLAVLERAAAACTERHGILVLACVGEPVRFVLELGGLLASVRVTPTREQGVAAAFA